jgi:ligand-binding sensor domain-containing protein/serine phosphatase RsbU (regulator of sigma subunit)
MITAPQKKPTSLKWWLTLCVVICCALVLRAQEVTTQFVPITTEDGLADLTITAIVQDEYGYMWFATKNGLHKYDGYSLEVFTHDPSNPKSLSSSVILDMIADRDGFLWIATESDGLNRFDPNTEAVKRFRHDEKDENSLISDQVYSLLEAKDGRIWMGTFNQGFCIYDKKTDQFERHFPKENSDQHVAKGTIWSIYQTADEHIWVSTWGGGLDHYDPKMKLFVHYQHDSLNPNSIASNMAGPLIEDRNGFIWVTTWGDGLERLDRVTGTFKHYRASNGDTTISSNILWPLTEDLSGNLWIGTYEKGLDKFNPETGLFTNYRYDPKDPKKFVHNNIWSLYIDKTGILWIGTEGGGIMKHSGILKQFGTISPAAPEDSSAINELVKSVGTDIYGNIWIGTWYYGLKRFDPATGAVRSFYRHDKAGSGQIGMNQVRAIMGDSKGHLWVGSNRQGLYGMDVKSEQIMDYQHDPKNEKTLSHNNIRALCEDEKGNIWVGTTRGLNKLNVFNNTFTRYLHSKEDQHSISNNQINGISCGKNGILWVGTNLGLNKLDMSTGQFSVVGSTGQKFSHSTIYAVYTDKEGVVWVGTRNGLNSYDPKTKSIQHYHIEKLEAQNHINAIQEDNNGQLWLSTNYGLLQFDRKSGSFSLYDHNEGLQVLNYAYGATCKTTNGQLYFGGIGGVTSFHPDFVQRNSYAPKIQLTGFKADGEALHSKSELLSLTKTEVSYSVSTFSISYTGFSYNDPEKTRYAYMMEGHDSKWNYVGNVRQARYSGLAPGTYKFKVKASNEDGLWSKESIITIYIPTPYWQKWWFYLICVLVLGLLVFTVIKLRERKLQREKRVLESIVTERTAEVVLQKEIIEEKNVEMLDSILYAKGIQDSILPDPDFVKKHLPDSFVYFKPKDIVSGDFYWMDADNDTVYFAVADCTGHGVPGAFVSMVGANGLVRTVNEYGIKAPDAILDKLTVMVEETFKDRKDGMDIALCSLAFSPVTGAGGLLRFAGAHNPLYVIRESDQPLIVDGNATEPKLQYADRNLFEIKANKQPIGSFEGRTPFNGFDVKLEKGDAIYVFSDGYPDQFGGPKGKKFKYATFKKLLLEHYDKTMEEQLSILDETFENWRGELEQVDDICIIGVKV